MQKNSVVKTIYTFASVVLLTVFFQVVFCYSYDFDYETSSIVLYAFIFSGVIAAFSHIPKLGKFFVIVVLLSLGVIWLLSNDDFTEIFTDLFYWFIDYSMGHASGDEGSIDATKTISFILIICLSYLLQHSLIGRIVSSLVVIATCGFCGYYEYDISRAIISLALIYIVLVAIEISLRFSQKIKNENKRIITVSRLSPFVVAIVLIVNLIPSSSEPLQWGNAQGLIRNVKSLYSKATSSFKTNNKSNESSNKLGFSDGIKLGGSISHNNAVAMEIKFSIAPKRNIYLIGAINDTYKNNGWSRLSNSSAAYYMYHDNDEYLVDEYIVDYMEAYYSLIRSGLMLRSNEIIETNNVEVEYKELDVDNLFYVPKINRPFISANNYNASGSTIFFEDKEVSYTKYIVSYTSFDQSSLLFKEYIGRNIGHKYRSNEIIGNQEYPQDMLEETGYDSQYPISFMMDYFVNNFYSEISWYDVDIGRLLANRAEKIRKVYTQLPDDMPDRVYDLAEQITAGKSNEYEKLKAIENFLKDNYTYSKKPGSIPKGKDAVDYFLFENKKGYCEHFASSMAVLARCVGIPTRVAQGYLVKVSPYGNKTDYKVTESDAHAWTEGYIEGIGWVPFEPTASYTSFTDKEKEKTQESSSEVESKNEDSSSSINDSSKIDDSKDSSNEVSSVQDSDTSIVDERNEEASNASVENALYIALIILVVIIILIPTASYTRITMTFKKCKKRYENADLDNKVYMDFIAIMKLLERKKLTIKQGETLYEFVNRINEFEDNVKLDITDSMKVYMKLRYGGLSVTDIEQKKVQNTKQHIENLMKEKLSVIGYFNLSYKIAKSVNTRFK